MARGGRTPKTLRHAIASHTFFYYIFFCVCQMCVTDAISCLMRAVRGVLYAQTHFDCPQQHEKILFYAIRLLNEKEIGTKGDCSHLFTAHDIHCMSHECSTVHIEHNRLEFCRCYFFTCSRRQSGIEWSSPFCCCLQSIFGEAFIERRSDERTGIYATR